MSPLIEIRSVTQGSRDAVNRLAKRRARARLRERGAIMFIVAMTIAVIGAMGIYALQLASAEVRTAGFIRQQMQTAALSSYGIGVSAQALAVNPQIYASIMVQQPDAACYSLFGIQGTTMPLGVVLGGNPAGTSVTAQANACHRAGSPELAAQITPAGTTAVTLISYGTPLVPLTTYAGGSDLTRGPIGLPTTPDFFVEVTDPTQRLPPPGYSANQSATVCFLEASSSSIGVTPTTATYNATDAFSSTASGFRSEGLEMSRARIMFGPVQCTGTN